MRKLLILIPGLALLGCPPDATVHLPHRIDLGHAKDADRGGDTLSRSSKLWMELVDEHPDTLAACPDGGCPIDRILLIGRQRYLGRDYDTIDVLGMYGEVAPHTRHLFDDSYALLGDSLDAVVAQRSLSGSFEVRSSYRVR